MNIIHDYTLVKRIGTGMYGDVWQAHHIHNKKEIAVKVERKSTINSLKYEMIILRHLKHLQCIPNIGLFGQTPIHNYIVMELLGNTIDVYYDTIPNNERIGEIKWIGLKMLDCLREIHVNSIIHRDIKPENFLLTSDKKSIKLIDFGLAKQFTDNQGRHKPCIKQSKLVGTMSYISTYVHEGYEPCRRDDLISMTYILIYLWNQSLPWQGLKDCGNNNKIQQMYDLKTIMEPVDLCVNFSTKIVDILDYVFMLGYSDEPDYEYLSFLLKTIE